MYNITCYKIGSQWFLDLPDFLTGGGKEEDLECIGSLSEFLNQNANGETTISFRIDSQPFQNAVPLELSGTSGGESGAYYRFSSWKGKPYEREIWINKVVYFCFKLLPDTIYIQQV